MTKKCSISFNTSTHFFSFFYQSAYHHKAAKAKLVNFLHIHGLKVVFISAEKP